MTGEGLSARTSWIALLLYLGIQILVGFVAGTAAGVLYLAGGGDPNDPEALQRSVSSIVAPASILGVLIATAWVAWRVLAGEERPARSRAIGWRSSSSGWLGGALALGAAIAFGTIELGPRLLPVEDAGPLGPLAEMAAAHDWRRIVWLCFVLVVAPPTEEFVFRGVVFSGFASSWGSRRAATVTTLVFVALHLSEALAWWPGLIGVTGMGIATVMLRSHSGSLGPPLAAHLGYNGIVAMAVLGSG